MLLFIVLMTFLSQNVKNITLSHKVVNFLCADQPQASTDTGSSPKRDPTLDREPVAKIEATLNREPTQDKEKSSDKEAQAPRDPGADKEKPSDKEAVSGRESNTNRENPLNREPVSPRG